MVSPHSSTNICLMAVQKISDFLIHSQFIWGSLRQLIMSSFFFFSFPFPNWWYKRCSGNLVLYPLNGVNVLLDPQPLGNGWGRDMGSVGTPKSDTDLFPLLRLSSYHSLCDVILLRLGGLMPRSDWKNVPHPAVIHAMTLLLRIEAFWVLFNSLFFLLRKKKL